MCSVAVVVCVAAEHDVDDDDDYGGLEGWFSLCPPAPHFQSLL